MRRLTCTALLCVLASACGLLACKSNSLGAARFTTCDGAPCPREREPPRAALAPAAPPSAPPSAKVGIERTRNADGRTWTLTADVAEPPLHLSLATALEAPTDVTLVIVRPFDGDTAAACKIAVLADGATATFDARDRQQALGAERLRVRVPFEVVERLATAERWGVRACGDELRASPSSREIVREFVKRVHEEAAWNGGAPPGPAVPGTQI